MGILDSDTVIVDAILTKLGRNKLRQGQPLGITQYSFGDTGVDYTLYNPDHPSGSDAYGSAITSLPMLEAVPDDDVFLRSQLYGTGERGIQNYGLGGSAQKTNSFSGSMATNQSNSLSGTLSATIVRVFPNGNLEIKGQKKLRITEGTEYIRLSGIIRPEDISTTNTVSSAKIAEAQIEYVGAGILDSATKPGWGSKIFRAISPF